jgi:predicted DNA-binding transcriptional regulator AlpA
MKMMTFEYVRESVLKMSRPAANTKITRGEFVQPYQIGGKLLFSEDEVMAWVQAQPKGLYPQPESLKKAQAARKVKPC